MALGTLSGLKAALGIVGTDSTRDESLSALLAQTEAAIKKLCRPYQFEAVTQTDEIRPAPWNTPILRTALFPVRSVASVYFNPTAYGLAANFDSTHLLTANTDYFLPLGMQPEGWSRYGEIQRLNRANWGVTHVRPLGRLASAPADIPGAVKITYSAGHTTVPADVTLALYLAARLVYGRREGAPVASESWNGGSVSYAGPFTVTAAVNSPDVRQHLSAYMTPMGVA